MSIKEVTQFQTLELYQRHCSKLKVRGQIL